MCSACVGLPLLGWEISGDLEVVQVMHKNDLQVATVESVGKKHLLAFWITGRCQ